VVVTIKPLKYGVGVDGGSFFKHLFLIFNKSLGKLILELKFKAKS
jgi:hypothetical protein